MLDSLQNSTNKAGYSLSVVDTAHMKVVSQINTEGNHRCGALIISYLLAREGKPPFVLTVDNAKAYFDPSTLIKATRKTPFALLFTLPHLGRDFAQFLKAQADDQYLL